MNQDLKRIYLAIRSIAPLWPAYKALASARESLAIANKILCEVRR